MLTIAIPRAHKIGDTLDVRINFAPARLTWADLHTLVINGTDRRRILQTTEIVDGAGRPCWSFLAGDAAADIAAGKAPDTLTVITPEMSLVPRQPLPRRMSVRPRSQGMLAGAVG